MFLNRMIISLSFLVVAALTLGGTPQAAAQDLPVLVAKPYPGSVPEHMKNGKHATCGDNKEAYCFLTRDPIDKVSAFYAQQGIKLETTPASERAKVGGWLSNFEQSLRVDLEAKPSVLLVAPLEFYKTKGADDVPSYFNAIVVMSKAKKNPLQADNKGQQAILEDNVLGIFALSPVSKTMVPLYSNIFMEPALLVAHYNRHLTMMSGYFREVDGNSAAKMKYVEMHPDWTQPMGASSDSDLDAKQDALRQELQEILSRKPDKKREYRSLMRGVSNREKRKKVQPELDRLLLSDPELAAWKKRSDALEQKEKDGAAQGSAGNVRTLKNEDVEAYLQALEKETYTTRILIHKSEGRRVTRDAATIRREWGH